MARPDVEQIIESAFSKAFGGVVTKEEQMRNLMYQEAEKYPKVSDMLRDTTNFWGLYMCYYKMKKYMDPASEDFDKVIKWYDWVCTTKPNKIKDYDDHKDDIEMIINFVQHDVRLYIIKKLHLWSACEDAIASPDNPFNKKD